MSGEGQGGAGGTMTGEDKSTARAPRPREGFIPLLKSDLLTALIAEPGLSESDREPFRRFARLLGAVLHYEYFDELERLRETYFQFNPDADPSPPASAADREPAYGDLTGEFTRVLARANFIEVSHEEIVRAFAESAMVRVKIKAPVEDFREVRIFHRGRHQETIEVPSLFGLRKRTHDTEIFDDVVLMAAAKTTAAPAARGTGPAKKQRDPHKIRPGAVLFKYFRHIASADLNALFPNARVVMSLTDQLTLGVPAILGGIPILIKLASTATVLFLVVGFYLGITGAIGDNDLEQALAAISGVMALGAFLLRQWGNFHRQSLQHQKQLTDNIYYRNLNNNAGIFDYLVGEAEEQEWKEALLAYYTLFTARAPLTRAALDDAIEAFLARTLKVDVEFQIGDALEKLTRFGLLREQDGQLSAPPLAEAMTQLDKVWDGYFAPA